MTTSNLKQVEDAIITLKRFFGQESLWICSDSEHTLTLHDIKDIMLKVDDMDCTESPAYQLFVEVE